MHAQEHLAAAIEELERLRSHLMLEYRTNFLEDKGLLYEDMIGVCLELDQPALGLEYAERAKSRALVDLVAFHLDLDVTPRNAGDLPLTEKLAQLRSERDRLHRRQLVVDRLEDAELADGQRDRPRASHRAHPGAADH